MTDSTRSLTDALLEEIWPKLRAREPWAALHIRTGKTSDAEAIDTRFSSMFL